MSQPVTGGRERRKFGRKACRVPATVKTARNETIPCVLLDFSEGGARLEFVAPVKLNGQFDLVISQLALAVPCQLRHAFGRTVGIEFIEQPGRRTLCSAFGTQKLLNWLDQQARPAHGAGPELRTRKVSSAHPLRSSIATSSATDSTLAEGAGQAPAHMLPSATATVPAFPGAGFSEQFLADQAILEASRGSPGRDRLGWLKRTFRR